MPTLDVTIIRVFALIRQVSWLRLIALSDPSRLPSGLSSAHRYSGGTAGDSNPVPYSPLTGHLIAFTYRPSALSQR